VRSERAEVSASTAKVKKELQDMAEAMKVEFGDVEADARQEYESVREEVGWCVCPDRLCAELRLTKPWRVALAQSCTALLLLRLRCGC
jgi:hypothetical protein